MTIKVIIKHVDSGQPPIRIRTIDGDGKVFEPFDKELGPHEEGEFLVHRNQSILIEEVQPSNGKAGA